MTGRFEIGACVAASLAALACVCAAQQEKPLTRTFASGAREAYRVEVTIRSEVHGISSETIGAKTYVKPIVRAADGTLAWTAVRRIGRIGAGGAAEIEESLEGPAGECLREANAEKDLEALRDAVRRFCESWSAPRVIHYREGKDGSITDFPKEAAPDFGEDDVLLLSSWSRHAWRPSAILPSLPVRIGERRQQTTNLVLPALKKVEASDTTEWLPAPGDVPAANLHVVQQIASGELLIPVAGSPEPAQRHGEKTFFAESLSTLSLLDGSLLDATRSAARETSWTLDPVEGLPDAPKFSSKLSVTVTIHRLR